MQAPPPLYQVNLVCTRQGPRKARCAIDGTQVYKLCVEQEHRRTILEEETRRTFMLMPATICIEMLLPMDAIC